MKIRVGRIVIAAIVAEVLAALPRFLLGVFIGLSDTPPAARASAEGLGYWVGPIAAFVFCLLGGFWVARGLPAAQVLNGLILGVVVAGIEIGITIASGATLEPNPAVSNIGKVIGGSLGGWIAARFSKKAA